MKKLIQEKDVFILFDEDTFRRFVNNSLGNYNAVLAEIQGLVRENGFDDNETTLQNITSRGSEYLREKAVSDFNAWAKKVHYPGYLVEDGRKRASESLDEGFVRELEALRTKLRIEFNNMLFKPLPGDMIFKEGVLQVSETFVEKVKRACQHPVTEKDIQDAKTLISVMEILRELDSRGICCRRVVNYFLGSRYAPAEFPDLTIASVIEYVDGTREKSLDEAVEEFKKNGKFAVPIKLNRDEK